MDLFVSRIHIHPLISCLLVGLFLNAAHADTSGVLRVDSIATLEAAVSAAEPGATIELANGTYDLSTILDGTGTATNPIVVRAQTPGEVNIRGNVTLRGQYVSLVGMSFTHDGAVSISGTGARLSRSHFSNVQERKWVIVAAGSSRIEIDHCLFENKENNTTLSGGAQLLRINVRNNNERHHIHRNHFRDIPKGANGNGYETLQLITEGNPFDPGGGDCNTIIEDNLFERCIGEAETISVKSNGNIIRGNTFIASRELVLRHGHRNVAEGNFFFGGGEPTSGGIRMQGRDQVIVNNYFQDLGRFGVGMMDGTPDDLYVRVERAKIAHNTMIDCGNALVVGINHSLHPNGTAPKDCLIANNLFLDRRADPSALVNLVQDDEPENWTWTGNIYSGDLGMAPISGVSQLDPQLDFGQEDIALPTANTPLVDALEGFPETENDLFGASRNSQTSVGAIQFSENLSVSGPLTAAEVGPQGLELIMEPDTSLTATPAHPLNPGVYAYGSEGFTATWSQVSGPATTFADPSSHQTTVALPTEGIYVLRLTVNSGTESVAKDITLTVIVNTPPLVDAGQDQTKFIEASQPWTPDQINKAAWYDAGDTTSITANSGAVSQWNDKSGNDLHLTQLSASSQPATSTRTLNTRNVLDFDGSDDFMANDGLGTDIRSLFVVFAPDQTITSSSDNQWLTSTVGGEVTSGLVLGASTSAFPGEVLTILDEDEPNIYVDRQGVSDATLGAIDPGGQFASSVLGTDWFLGLNGSGDLRDLTSGTRNALTYSSSFGVGASLRRLSETKGFLDGGIAEILCLSSEVDASTRQKIEGYLAHKWGLSGHLPADHPHKTVPPEGASVAATLEGSVSDAEGHDLEISWSMVSGPAPVVFDSPNAATTSARFTLPGDYVLRLSAYDGFATTTDELTVTVAEESAFEDENTNGIDDAWELSNFGALLGEEDIRHESGVPFYFLYLAGWTSGEAVGDAGRIDILRESSGTAPVIAWDFADGFELGVHAEVWVSTDLVDWGRLPSSHYSHSTQSADGTTRHEVEITHDYGERVFLRLQKP